MSAGASIGSPRPVQVGEALKARRSLMSDTIPGKALAQGGTNVVADRAAALARRHTHCLHEGGRSRCTDPLEE